jgi:hypothetical protein
VLLLQHPILVVVFKQKLCLSLASDWLVGSVFFFFQWELLGYLLRMCGSLSLHVFQFAELFDFECCSLAQEVNFVVIYLPCFRQWLITHLLWPFCLSSCLFTEVGVEISSLILPPSPMGFQCFCSLCCVLVFSLLFIVQFLFIFFLFFYGGIVSWGMLVTPRGDWGNTT